MTSSIDTLISSLGIVVLVVFCYMLGWFILAMLTKRNDIVDIAWGLGFIVATYASFFLEESTTPKQMVLMLLVTLWALRLSLHLFFRNRKKSEDARYANWRKEWGKWFVPRTFLQVFMLQGLMLIMVSLPVHIVHLLDNTGPIIYINYIGIAIWYIGLVFESVADMELLQFMRRKKSNNELLTTGLWKYSRHPNYFGEIMMWWGIWLVAYGSPYALLGLIGPITITVLLTQVSGIPMTERLMQDKAGWKEYVRRTSVLIPWFPKR